MFICSNEYLNKKFIYDQINWLKAKPGNFAAFSTGKTKTAAEIK